MHFQGITVQMRALCKHIMLCVCNVRLPHASKAEMFMHASAQCINEVASKSQYTVMRRTWRCLLSVGACIEGFPHEPDQRQQGQPECNCAQKHP